MLTLFGGCTNDDDYNNGNGSVDKGDAVQLTLELSVPGVSSPTYALSDVDENTLKEIDILVFKYKGENVDETYLYRTHATDIVNNTNGITTSKKFKAMLQKSTESDKHRIVLIANARDAVDHAIRAVEEDLESGVVQMTKAEVLARIKFDTNRKWVTNSSEDFDPIPMWGEASSALAITATTTDVSIGAIRLLRSVARIDVGLDMENDYANGFGDRFKMEVVKVYNANGKSLVAPYAGNLQNRKATLPSLVEGISPMQEPIEYKHTPADFGFIREIYVGEARNKAQEGETLDDNDRCFIIIGGYYSKDGDPINETDLSWYRIDFYLRATGGEDAKPQERLDVLRNHRYKVNITKIDGPGYKNETDAVNSRPINMQTIVEAWDEGDMNDSNTDGQYQLVVNKSEFTLFKEGGANNPQKLKIYTDHPGGWRIEIPNSQPEDYSWINVSIDNDQSLTSIEVDITAEEYDGQDESRTGYFYIYAGTMKKKIYVTQLNEAELSIEVTPNVLTFRKSARQPKSITVKTFPTNAKVYFQRATEGNNLITDWVNFPPVDGVPNEETGGIYHFQPAENNTGRQLATTVTIYVQDDTGRIIPKTVVIKQQFSDLIFEVSDINLYPAAGGAQSFKVTSDTPWWIDSFTPGVGAFNGSPDGNPKVSGETIYSFTLLGNESWARKTMTLTPRSNDLDFSGGVIDLEQDFIAPYLEIDNTTSGNINIDLGYEKNPATKSVKVFSNAQWDYTLSDHWENAIASDGLETAQRNSVHTYFNRPNTATTINFVPNKYAVTDGVTIPAAGISFEKTVELKTINHVPATPVSRSIIVKRIVPVHFEYVSTTLASGSGNIPAAGTKMTVKVNTNTKVTAQANFTGGQTQNYIRGTIDAGNYAANKTTVLDIPANNSWESRTVKLSTWHSGVWNGTSFGSTELVEHATYTQAANYNYTISHTFSTFTVNGGTIKMTYAGNMGTAARQIRAVTKNGSTVTQIGISESSTSNNVHTLNISSVNWGTATRTIYVQYKDLAKNGEWKDYTTTISQPGTSYNVTGPSPSTLTGFEQELTVTYGGTMPTTGIRRVRITNEAGTTVLKTGTSVTTNKPTVTVPENNTGASRTLRIEYWNMGYNNGTGQWLQMTTLDQPSPYYSATQTKNGVSTNVKYIVHKTPIAPATVGTNGVVHTAQMIQADNNCRCRDVYGTGWEMLRMDDGLNHLDDYYLVSVDAGQGFNFYQNTTDQKYAVYTSKSTSGLGDLYNLHYVKNTAGGYGKIAGAQTLKDNGIYMWCTKRK